MRCGGIFAQFEFNYTAFKGWFLRQWPVLRGCVRLVGKHILKLEFRDNLSFCQWMFLQVHCSGKGSLESDWFDEERNTQSTGKISCRSSSVQVASHQWQQYYYPLRSFNRNVVCPGLVVTFTTHWAPLIIIIIIVVRLLKSREPVVDAATILN